MNSLVPSFALLQQGGAFRARHLARSSSNQGNQAHGIAFGYSTRMLHDGQGNHPTRNRTIHPFDPSASGLLVCIFRFWAFDPVLRRSYRQLPSSPCLGFYRQHVTSWLVQYRNPEAITRSQTSTPLHHGYRVAQGSDRSKSIFRASLSQEQSPRLFFV